MQLVMMYLIGRYLGEYVQLRGNRQLRYAAIGVYIVASLLTAVMGVYADSLTTFAYNQPLVIASSVALFVAFATMQFRSKVVNWLASGVFAAYLLHKNPYIWVGYVRPVTRQMWEDSTLLEFTALYIAATVAIYLAAVAIDQLRRIARVKVSR